MNKNWNAAGNPRIIAEPTTRIHTTPPREEVAKRQDPTHTRTDFLRDLDKATARTERG